MAMNLREKAAKLGQEIRFLFVKTSTNIKTGNIPQTYSSANSCPIGCPFRESGCFGENYGTNFSWARSVSALTIEGLKKAVQECTRKFQMIRHNVAGDMAKANSNSLDQNLLKALAEVFKDRRAYTYTHCNIEEDDAGLIRNAAKTGFIVNKSCETIGELKKAKRQGIPAVITVRTAEDVEQINALLKAQGENWKVIQCPSQTKGRTCVECKLCAVANRKNAIAFVAHGNKAGKAVEAINKKLAAIRVEVDCHA